MAVKGENKILPPYSTSGSHLIFFGVFVQKYVRELFCMKSLSALLWLVHQ